MVWLIILDLPQHYLIPAFKTVFRQSYYRNTKCKDFFENPCISNKSGLDWKPHLKNFDSKKFSNRKKHKVQINVGSKKNFGLNIWIRISVKKSHSKHPWSKKNSDEFRPNIVGPKFLLVKEILSSQLSTLEYYFSKKNWSKKSVT